jgi:hypothetical protein
MNKPTKARLELAINAVAIVGVFLIMAGLVWLMYHYTRPAPVDQARWTERKRNLAELNAQNQELLENYGWIDQGRGIARLPVARALELTVKEWRNPAAARTNLLARLERAVPAPASASPEAQKTNVPAGGNPK